MIIMLGSVVFSVAYFTKKDTDAKVVTTIFPIYDICREIMGDSEDIVLLESNGSDLHNYSPTSHDIATISKSELFIYIGGESDEWVDSVLKSTGRTNLKTLALLEKIEKLEESEDGVLDSHTDGEHEEVEYDEHIWLSLKNMIKMVTFVRLSLNEIFPERQKLFEENAEKYIAKLTSLESEYASALQGKTTPLIIADRFPFRYLVNDYNLQYYAVFSGCSAETEASPETIAKLIEKINESDINSVFVLETSDKSIANSALNDTRCNKTGIEILTINSCQSVALKNLEDTTYLNIMTSNLINLKRAITK